MDKGLGFQKHAKRRVVIVTDAKLEMYLHHIT
jgi:hypothetical protein